MEKFEYLYRKIAKQATEIVKDFEIDYCGYSMNGNDILLTYAFNFNNKAVQIVLPFIEKIRDVAEKDTNESFVLNVLSGVLAETAKREASPNKDKNKS